MSVLKKDLFVMNIVAITHQDKRTVLEQMVNSIMNKVAVYFLYHPCYYRGDVDVMLSKLTYNSKYILSYDKRNTSVWSKNGGDFVALVDNILPARSTFNKKRRYTLKSLIELYMMLNNIMDIAALPRANVHSDITDAVRCVRGLFIGEVKLMKKKMMEVDCISDDVVFVNDMYDHIKTSEIVKDDNPIRWADEDLAPTIAIEAILDAQHSGKDSKVFKIKDGYTDAEQYVYVKPSSIKGLSYDDIMGGIIYNMFLGNIDEVRSYVK